MGNKADLKGQGFVGLVYDLDVINIGDASIRIFLVEQSGCTQNGGLNDRPGKQGVYEE